jgi:hypothetical protein
MWSLVFTEDQRLAVFGDRVLKRVEVIRGWTETNEELHSFTTLSDVIIVDTSSMVRWTEHKECIGDR